MKPIQFRVALARLGLTQTEAADFLGLSLRTVNGYANGAPIPVAVVKLLELQFQNAQQKLGWPDEGE